MRPHAVLPTHGQHNEGPPLAEVVGDKQRNEFLPPPPSSILFLFVHYYDKYYCTVTKT